MSIYEVSDAPAASTIEHSIALGLAVKLRICMRRSPEFSFDQFVTNTTSAIIQQRIIFFFDEFGEPLGYVVWANLDIEVSERVTHMKRFVLHKSEWNEGNELWIVDCAFQMRGARNMLKKFVAHISSFKEFRYLRVSRDGTVVTKFFRWF